MTNFEFDFVMRNVVRFLVMSGARTPSKDEEYKLRDCIAPLFDAEPDEKEANANTLNETDH